MISLPDHPDIRSAELTGYGCGHREVYPVCPVCGMECETIYYQDLDIVGCEECITWRDAWNVSECFPGEKNL